MTITNASQFPKVFYARHMQPGTVGYDDGVVLVDTEGMKNLALSAKDRSIPVYIGHQDVDLKKIKEQADGYVCDSFYNEVDGWCWFKFIAVDDSVFDAIKKGWSVSNAYIVSEWGPGGTKNNIAYKREVRNGEFSHLAIVPDPRYEGACIMTAEEYRNYQETHRKKHDELKNSKGTKPMLKFFKTEKKEVSGAEIDMDTMVELANGKSISIGEMVKTVENSVKQEAEIEVGGQKMTVKELMAAYVANSKKKKNEKEETESHEDEDVEGDQGEEGDDEIGQDKKNKKSMKNKKMKKNEKEEDGCMNSDDEDADEEEEKMTKNKKMKKNSKSSDDDDGEIEVEVDDKYFNSLKNAHLKPQSSPRPQLIVTSLDQVKRGQKLYGSDSKK